jgi:nitroreductase
MPTTTPTIELMNARCSTRAYAAAPISDDEKTAILHATMRAPTAGNMMLYSVIEIGDQALKERLAETCDDQPFIARAPWVLLFVADLQKWMDLFDAAGVDGLEGAPHGVTPGPGDLMMACCDALIAAQNAVIAAESLGIGSCYIGDILEQAETHAELFGLPRWTMPVTLLCLGRPKMKGHVVERYERHVVHHDRYRRLDRDELRQTCDELDTLYGQGGASGAPSFVGDVYARKFTAAYAAEMNRSVAWWLERWQAGTE